MHGFRKDAALTACCGDGGPHNSGVLFSCNATSVLCPDASEHISWDGVHLTEAARVPVRGAGRAGRAVRRAAHTVHMRMLIPKLNSCRVACNSNSTK